MLNVMRVELNKNYSVNFNEKMHQLIFAFKYTFMLKILKSDKVKRSL